MILDRARFTLWIAVAFAVLLVLVAWSFSVGRFPVAAGDVASALWAALTGSESGLAKNVEAVILQVRAPRLLAALAVGAALSAAGAAYQNLFKNPLVSPDILGVSAGCALGAGLAILFSLPVVAIQGLAFAGGIGAVALVVAVGNWVGRRDPILTLILTGVVVGSLFGAGIALVKYVADPYNQLPAITFWLLGSFGGALPADLAVALPLIAIGLVPLVLLRWRIDLLALSEDEARSLGLDVARLRLAVIVCATLVTASAVALAGVIGWVGLVIPHAARLLVGASFARVMPLSLVLGAAFMLAV
ncbi:MAG: iron ABC transporter permease, partial [Burkholderiales bacterium]|nr:iron ABC transporter permease [Burkholderiales bacterium]